MARDAIQVQLEATEARIYNLDQRLTERLDRVVESIDKLAVQVTQFNAGMTELKGIARQILQAIEADRDVAKLQANNVQSMVQLAAQQQQTINTLIAKLAS
ncbi:MAG: hypothetical protein F6K28_20940 [Microcoleus sp. SIO2G3]|nr:hypothetical protein [Microcoleus sp. SIO2G3]